MRRLAARDILAIWETGADQRPIDRGLTILAAAFPERSPAELQRLSVGRRDALLGALRRQTFGSRLECAAECPECREQVEFDLDLDAVVGDDPPDPVEEGSEATYRLIAGEWEVEYRPPTSADLAAIADYADVGAARNALAQRCVVATRTLTGELPPPTPLPPAVVDLLATDLGAREAAADVALELVCPACGHPWETTFDVAAYFWIELEALARRLVWEVHVLANAYGWREADILAMSAYRRQSYLELVS
jgi:hypothetical protein